TARASRAVHSWMRMTPGHGWPRAPICCSAIRRCSTPGRSSPAASSAASSRTDCSLGILAALDLRFGHAQGTQLDAAHDGIEGDAAFDLAELVPQTVLEAVVEYEAVEDDQRDETPDRVGEVLLDLHRHGEGDDEDEDGSRDEDLTDRVPGIDVVADVTALGALVTSGEVLLLTVHHSDARTLALLTLLLLGLPVRNLAILVDQGLAAQ